MININSRLPIYDEDAVQPMRDELIAVGFEEMRSSESVDRIINVKDNKTILVFINSVCGCAAGAARPGVSFALQHKIIPDKLTTAFAGQDKDAVDSIRNKIINFPPSSPSIALFQSGELLYFMPRIEIEGFSAEQIAAKLIKVFDKYCSNQGPSVSPEIFENLPQAKYCGSKIPLYDEN